MKVTDYYPVFYVEDIESEIKRFTGELGFEVIHRPHIEFLDYAVLENEKKRRIDIVCSHFPADSFKTGFFGMRANVDDYEEGLAYFETQGYTLFGEPHDAGTSITALLKRDDGSCIILFHHWKK